MEIFGGFMVMMSILSFFMALVWLIMPFVVFTIKGKLDRTLDMLDGVEKRLAGIESQMTELKNELHRGSAGFAHEPVEPLPNPADEPSTAALQLH